MTLSKIELTRQIQKKLGIRLPKMAKLYASRETDTELVFELHVPKVGKRGQD